MGEAGGSQLPEAGQLWWKEVKEGGWLGERASGPQSGAEEMADWGNSGQLESDPFTLGHLEMPGRGLSLQLGRYPM